MSHSLQPEDIKPGKLYRSSDPAKGYYGGIVNDRRVVWISSDRMQVEYIDCAYPQQDPFLIRMHQFMKWADHEVFEG